MRLGKSWTFAAVMILASGYDAGAQTPGRSGTTRICDQFNGESAGVKIAACIADLPSTGGTADARGLDGPQTISSDPFSSVTKPVTLILGAGQYASSTDISVPSNVTVRFERGARLTMNGTSLTWRGGIDSGLYQIFGTTGRMSWGATELSRTVYIYPEWWGALGDGSTNDSEAFNAALASIRGGTEATLRLRRAEYCLGTPLAAINSVRIIGEGLGTNLKTGGSCANMGASNVLTFNASGGNGLHLEGFQITGTSTQLDGIEINNAHLWRIDSVHINKVGGTGFQINASYSGTMINSSVSSADRGLEIQRVGEGSGGVTVVGFLSSDITSFGARIEASVGVALINCELNVYGPNGIGLYVAGNATPVYSSGVEISGGLYVGNKAGIQIGAAGTGPVYGVTIHGANIIAWTNPVAGSAGVLVTTDKAYGVDIRGNEIKGWSRAIKTTGIISGDVTIGVNSVRNLVGDQWYVDQNGAQMVTADGKGLPTTASLTSAGYDQAAGTLAYRRAGRVHSDTVAVGNSGTGERSLMTWTMPAGILNETGRSITVKVWGDTAANGNNKTLRCYYDSQLIASFGPTASNKQPWSLEYTILVGPTLNAEQILVSSAGWNGKNEVVTTLSATVNTGTASAIKCTGEGRDDNDIVQRGLIVQLLP